MIRIFFFCRCLTMSFAASRQIISRGALRSGRFVTRRRNAARSGDFPQDQFPGQVCFFLPFFL